MATRQLQIAGTNVRLVSRNTVPASGTMLDHGFAKNGPLVAVEYSRLTRRLLHG